MPEAVNHPAHYNAHPSGVECIDVVEEMTFNVGNAVKYLWRADHKNDDPIEDLEKALWYVKREIRRIRRRRKRERLSAEAAQRLADNGGRVPFPEIPVISVKRGGIRYPVPDPGDP